MTLIHIGDITVTAGNDYVLVILLLLALIISHKK